MCSLKSMGKNLQNELWARPVPLKLSERRPPTLFLGAFTENGASSLSTHDIPTRPLSTIWLRATFLSTAHNKPDLEPTISSISNTPQKILIVSTENKRLNAVLLLLNNVIAIFLWNLLTHRRLNDADVLFRGCVSCNLRSAPKMSQI